MSKYGKICRMHVSHGRDTAQIQNMVNGENGKMTWHMTNDMAYDK